MEALSADDIDRLLSSVKAGGEPSPKAEKVSLYDFRRPYRFSKEHIQVLGQLHQVFARLMTASLSAHLVTEVRFDLASVDQLLYEEFIRSVPNPSTFFTLTMDPLRGSALMQVDPTISFAWVERLMGGPASRLNTTREHTETEISLLEGMAVRLLGNWRESWSSVMDLRPRLAQVEINPMYVQIVPPEEVVLLLSFQVTLDAVEGYVHLCIPWLVLEPIIDRFSHGRWKGAPLRGGTTESLVATRMILNLRPVRLWSDYAWKSLHSGWAETIQGGSWIPQAPLLSGCHSVGHEPKPAEPSGLPEVVLPWLDQIQMAVRVRIATLEGPWSELSGQVGTRGDQELTSPEGQLWWGSNLLGTAQLTWNDQKAVLTPPENHPHPADLNYRLSAVLGTCHWDVRSVLSLGSGSVIPLGRSASTVALHLENLLFGEAEVTAVDDNFAVYLKARAIPTTWSVPTEGVELRAILGETTVTGRQAEELAAQSMVTINRKTGQDAILEADGIPLARVEVLVIDGDFAVRVKGILSPPTNFETTMKSNFDAFLDESADHESAIAAEVNAKLNNLAKEQTRFGRTLLELAERVETMEEKVKAATPSRSKEETVGTLDPTSRGILKTVFTALQPEESARLLRVLARQFDGEFAPLRKVLEEALGSSDAVDLINRATAALSPEFFSIVARAEASTLANLLSQEHPQTLAMILSHFEPPRVAALLDSFPVPQRFDILHRMATLGTVGRDSIREVERILEKRLSSLSEASEKPLGGPEIVQQILRSTDIVSRQAVIQHWEEEDPEGAIAIKKEERL